MQRIEWTERVAEFARWRGLTELPVGIQGANALDPGAAPEGRVYRAVAVAREPSLAPVGDPGAEPATGRPPGYVWIRPGSFSMGSPVSEPGRSTNEMQHTVLLSRGFWMSDHEVTQSEYRAIAGSNPSGNPGDERPVEQIGWEEARAYCDALTARSGSAGTLPRGYAYRLPTEAEWEYACRAGSTEAHPWGADVAGVRLPDFAWYRTNALEGTMPVRSRAPNAWGLHDMIGNVWEWCLDWYVPLGSEAVEEPAGPRSGSFRAARGGSYLDTARLLRSAVRYGFLPDWPGDYVGFRPVLALVGAPGAGELHLRFVPELTVTGLPGSTFRLERTADPEGVAGWQSITNLGLGTNRTAVWVDTSAGVAGRSYRVVSVHGGGGFEAGPGEPPGRRPPGFVWIPAGRFRMGSPESEMGFAQVDQVEISSYEGFYKGLAVYRVRWDCPDDALRLMAPEQGERPELAAVFKDRRVTIAWPDSPGHPVLESSDDPSAPVWDVVFPLAVSRQGQLEVAIPAPVKPRYFRLSPP